MSGTSRRRVIQLRDGAVAEHGDSVAVEEPVEIIVDGVMASTTMRTPGHDVELALGWLVSEGVVRHADDVVQAKEC